MDLSTLAAHMGAMNLMPLRSPRALAAAALAALALLGSTACTPTSATVDPAAPAPAATSIAAPQAVQDRDETAQAPATATSGQAMDALQALAVKGRAPKTGYDRDQFGQAWADVDRNGCDTRNDILSRDLTGVTHKPGTHGCVVLTGTLSDPFTGTAIDFTRGQSTSSAVQIDHVVALSDAWQKGAQQLDADTRTAFANDPLNLLAVDGPSNSQKSDSDAASWLPANKSFRCDYVARQIAVKATYHLWVTQAEKEAMTRVLDTCPGHRLPTTAAAPAVEVALAAPEPVQAPEPARVPDQVIEEVSYANCTEARAAGAAPLYRGQPGYAEKMDRDGDGVACE